MDLGFDDHENLLIRYDTHIVNINMKEQHNNVELRSDSNL